MSGKKLLRYRHDGFRHGGKFRNATQRLHALRGMGCVAKPRLLNDIVRDKDIAKRHFLLMPLLRKTLPPRYLFVSRWSADKITPEARLAIDFQFVIRLFHFFPSKDTMPLNGEYSTAFRLYLSTGARKCFSASASLRDTKNGRSPPPPSGSMITRQPMRERIPSSIWRVSVFPEPGFSERSKPPLRSPFAI